VPWLQQGLLLSLLGIELNKSQHLLLEIWKIVVELTWTVTVMMGRIGLLSAQRSPEAGMVDLLLVLTLKVMMTIMWGLSRSMLCLMVRVLVEQS
jgi:hypothetical protein